MVSWLGSTYPGLWVIRTEARLELLDTRSSPEIVANSYPINKAMYTARLVANIVYDTLHAEL